MENSAIFKTQFALNHSEISAHFSKNSSDFVVREVPLYEWNGSGEHCVILVQKKDLTTSEMLKILSEFLGVKMRDFGYAGLKDKEGMTTQFVSFPFKFSPNLSAFSHEKIKILDIFRHENKLRIGHLKGNNFFIRLKKVSNPAAKILENVLQTIDKNGFANYFGYQRFGKFGDNARVGEEILRGKNSIKNPKLRDFFISAYQSEIFNRWLSRRVEISKFAREFNKKEFAKIYPNLSEIYGDLRSENGVFSIMRGDVMGHYPFGKCFLCENLGDEQVRFAKRDIVPTGIIAGAKTLFCDGICGQIEREFLPDDEILAKMNGSRRFAWCYLENLKFNYDEENAHFMMSFYLPKGSYATVVLEEILHTRLRDYAPNLAE